MNPRWLASLLLIIGLSAMAPATDAGQIADQTIAVEIVDDWSTNLGGPSAGYDPWDPVEGSVRVVSNGSWIPAQIRFETRNLAGEPVEVTWLERDGSGDIVSTRVRDQMTLQTDEAGEAHFELAFPEQPELETDECNLTRDEIDQWTDPHSGDVIYPLVVVAIFDGSASGGAAEISGIAAASPGWPAGNDQDPEPVWWQSDPDWTLMGGGFFVLLAALGLLLPPRVSSSC